MAKKSKPNVKLHKLGAFSGMIFETDDGMASYGTATAGSGFSVRIADVSGFSVSTGGKATRQTIHVLGKGTVLASADVLVGAPRKIEEWFRAHPDWHGDDVAGGDRDTSLPAVSVGDELTKLADLRDKGVLSEDEFQSQKARLLNH